MAKAKKSIWIRTTGPWYEDGTAHPIGTEVERDEEIARAVIASGQAMEISTPATANGSPKA